jgi:hypothetical protein
MPTILQKKLVTLAGKNRSVEKDQRLLYYKIILYSAITQRIMQDHEIANRPLKHIQRF